MNGITTLIRIDISKITSPSTGGDTVRRWPSANLEESPNQNMTIRAP